MLPQLSRQIASRRTFSILTRARQVARSFEPHPFARNAVTQKAQKPDIVKMIRHIADPAVFYFPFFSFILGWPLLAEKLLDGRM